MATPPATPPAMAPIGGDDRNSRAAPVAALEGDGSGEFDVGGTIVNVDPRDEELGSASSTV